MHDSSRISPEARALALDLVKQRRITLRQLQQGYEWCARNDKTLSDFLESFCSSPASESPLASADVGDEGRRHFARLETNRTVWMEINEMLVEVSALNVSRGGIAFKGRWILPRGSEIKLGPEMQVLAIVRYCVDNGDGSATSGAEFEPRSVAEIQAIETLLATLKPKTLG